MNECNEEFLKKNGIVIEDVCSNIDSTIHTAAEENEIVSKYNFQTEAKDEMISVANIVGYDRTFYGLDKNIFLSMDHFFSTKGSTYHTRSVGMLEYDKDNIIESLKESFESEPISLIATGEGTYTILNNGLHRYTLLRVLYLSEAAKVKDNPKKLAELAKKYTIPASVTGVDLDKTYCKYLLKMVKSTNDDFDIVDVKNYYDSNYKLTGNVEVVYANGEKEILSKEMLLAMTKERVYEDETFKENYPRLQNVYNKYASFASFIQEKFSDVIQLRECNLEEKGIGDND